MGRFKKSTQLSLGVSLVDKGSFIIQITSLNVFLKVINGVQTKRDKGENRNLNFFVS